MYGLALYILLFLGQVATLSHWSYGIFKYLLVQICFTTGPRVCNLAEHQVEGRRAGIFYALVSQPCF